MSRSVCLFLGVFISSGCVVDYGLTPTGPVMDYVDGSELLVGEGLEVDIRIDVALQRNRWGEATQRCQLQLAFEQIRGEMGEPMPIVDISVPDEPGTCMYTDLSDQGEPGEGDPNQGQEPGEDPDAGNWFVDGDLAGAEQVFLDAHEGLIILERTELEPGRVRYELADCTAEHFPFGQVFDLVVPEPELQTDLFGFAVPEAFGIGPDHHITTPSDEDIEQGMLRVAAGEDLALRWEALGSLPTVAGETLTRTETVFVRNYELDEDGRSTGQEFEAIACQPDEHGRLDISAEDLGFLQFNDSADPESQRFGAAVQVDAYTISPPFVTPWSRDVSVKATVTEGGNVHLVP